MLKHLLGEGFVFGEKKIYCFAIESAGSIVGKLRLKVAAFAKVLIAGGALLAVPTLLVGEDDGGEDGKTLDSQNDVGQIRDGTVAVLEIERIEKLLRFLRADLAEGFLHRKSRTRVLGHGVGLNFGFGAVDSKDFDCRIGDSWVEGTAGFGLGGSRGWWRGRNHSELHGTRKRTDGKC